jgi:uncharacterized protein with HEPN domain
MSAPRDDRVFVQHLRDAISRIESYLDGVTEEHFVSTPLIQDAVIRQRQVIGQAAKNLSHEFRGRSAHVPWSEIAGMRDKIVHDYMNVDLAIVWETVTRDIPALRAALQGISER